MKNLLIAFGLLDLFSFFKCYKTMPYLYDKVGDISWINALLILTIVSLLVGGVLSLIRSKYSLYVYYVQFPLRMMTAILSFYFLRTLFTHEPPAGKMDFLLGVIMALEFVRLALTIFIHKKYFSKQTRQVELTN